MYGECDWPPEEDTTVDQATLMRNNLRERLGSNDRPQLVIDREIQNLCRPLHGEEHSLLEEDIKVRGCIDPITCWKDPQGRYVILDGHHRDAICRELGIQPPVKVLEFETKEEAINWVIEHQLGRRDLSSIERAILIGKQIHLNMLLIL